MDIPFCIHKIQGQWLDMAPQNSAVLLINLRFLQVRGTCRPFAQKIPKDTILSFSNVPLQSGTDPKEIVSIPILHDSIAPEFKPRAALRKVFCDFVV